MLNFSESGNSANKPIKNPSASSTVLLWPYSESLTLVDRFP